MAENVGHEKKGKPVSEVSAGGHLFLHTVGGQLRLNRGSPLASNVESPSRVSVYRGFESDGGKSAGLAPHRGLGFGPITNLSSPPFAMSAY